VGSLDFAALRISTVSAVPQEQRAHKESRKDRDSSPVAHVSIYSSEIPIQKRDAMKKLTLAILLLLSTVTLAADPNPADYTINVHVTTSRMVIEVASTGFDQRLDVIIDGKKYVLESGQVNVLLALGDYKAKLVRDEHRTTYDSRQTYEFLFPDGKTRRFEAVGLSE
jgi:hypothetical protein